MPTTPVYDNLVRGKLGADLGDDGPGAFSDASFAGFPDVAAGVEHAWIVFDPLGVAPEIAKVTEAGSGTLTLERAAAANSGAAQDWPEGTKWVLGWLTEDAVALLYAVTTTISDDYTLVASDAGRVIEHAHADPHTLTVPDLAVGAIVEVYNIGAGVLTITGDAGVTVVGAGDLAAGATASLRQRAADEWVAVGELT